jgi:multisubunit Na+/H+ antiporter MnhB subunit
MDRTGSEESRMKNAGLVSAVVLGIIVLVIGAAVLNGFMLSYMWQWFVVPLGVRAIGVPQAVGIAIICSIVTYREQPKNSEPDEGLNKILLQLAAKVVAFGVAFVLSFMVPA